MRWINRIILIVTSALALLLISMSINTNPGSSLGPKVGIWRGDPPVTFAQLGLRHPRPTRYRHARDSDRFYPVNINNWWGYANQSGDLLIYPGYDWADYFYDSLARVILNNKTGFIDKSNNITIPIMFPYADHFQNGMAIVGDGKGDFGFINKAGEFVVPVVLTGALRFHENVAAVQVGKKIGYVNKAGEVLVTPQFAQGRSFYKNVAFVRFFNDNGKKGNWGAIDRNGELIWENKSGDIDFLGSFHDGLAKVKVNKKWGYISHDFNFSIPPTFEDARHFENNVAAVKLHSKWGYINKNGKFILKPQFDKAYEFTSSMAMIKQNGKFGYVNKTGSRYIRPKFAKARPFFDKRARVSMSPSFGYINIANQSTWDPKDPLQGIVDTTLLGQLAARYNHNPPTGNPVFPAPPQKISNRKEYPPDYKYHDILPKPKDNAQEERD